MMLNKKLTITDERMLPLPGRLKDLGVIGLKAEFWEAIGIKKQNVTGIKSGRQHFTVAQIQRACDTYNINPSYIFGFSDILFRQKETVCLKQKLKQNRIKRSINKVSVKA